MEKFFDTIASRVRGCFKSANNDAEAWLKVIMAPLEAQIRQHKDQLKHRLASIQRIHDATDSLEQKIDAFERGQQELEAQKARLNELAGDQQRHQCGVCGAGRRRVEAERIRKR
jgi:chromosome segregation ATPase